MRFWRGVHSKVHQFCVVVSNKELIRVRNKGTREREGEKVHEAYKLEQ